MSLLQEATLDRLWARYEREFGAPPPIQSATLDEAIAYLRDALEARRARRPERAAAAAQLPLAA